MDDIYSVLQIGIIALVAGALIGALAYRLLAPSVKQAGKVKSELDETREELNDYKASVNSHFNKTSELVNDLTQNYVRVYQHLAEGAQTLGDSKALNNLLEQHQGKVLLTVDGAPTPRDASDEAAVVEATETAESPATAVDEHAEPFVAAKGGEAEPQEVEAAAPVSDEAAAEPETDDKPDAGEPVLDVKKIEEVAERVEAEASAVAESGMPETKDKAENRPVTH